MNIYVLCNQQLCVSLCDNCNPDRNQTKNSLSLSQLNLLDRITEQALKFVTPSVSLLVVRGKVTTEPHMVDIFGRSLFLFFVDEVMLPLIMWRYVSSIHNAVMVVTNIQLSVLAFT